jgi:hypothetical protein
MLLEWFIVLLCLSIALIIVSYIFKIPPIAIGGFTLLFLLGNVVLISNLEIQSGYNSYEVAPCEGNCTLVREGGETFLATTTNTTYTFNYSPISDETIAGVGLNHILGLFLALIGVVGFVDVVMNLKGLK